MTGPILFAHHLTGYVPKVYRYPFEGDIPEQYEASARVKFFDNVVDRYLPDITQFVTLGAGFDTRAYRLPQEWMIKSFEVDAPATQSVKQAILNKAGIQSDAVMFVPRILRKKTG